MRRNFDLSAALAALGAAIVVVALFFEWYEIGLSAWEAFEIVDWVLLALAIVALASLAGELAGRVPPNGRLPWIVGAIALLVFAMLIDPPPAAAESERAFGAWLALGGVLLLVAGMVLALMRISVTIDVADRERRRRTTAVDARASDSAAGAKGDEAAAASDAPVPGAAAASGLWKRPSEDKPKGRVEGESAPSEAPTTATPADPDRTQPLPPTERPSDDG